MQAPTASSWSQGTHRFIEQEAELVFANNPHLAGISYFLSTHHDNLYNWCTWPDGDASFMPDDSGEEDWHYVDAQSYNPLVIKAGQDGELHLAMKWILDNIVYYLKNGDNAWAANLMGAICHFTGDATCPLHATWDFSPGGKHGAFETVAASHSNDDEMSIPTDYVPRYLDDVTNAALLTLKDSFNFTDEDPNGGTNLSDYLEVGTTWNDWIKSMTENRIGAAARFTADVWYTAFVRAGIVPLRFSPVDVITPYYRSSVPFTITATTSESLQSVWLYCRYSSDNASWGDWTLYGTDTASPWQWSFTTQDDGFYEFYSIARKGDNVDSPPNTADASCAVDSTAPASSVNVISPYWRNSSSFQITATVSDATSGVENVSLYCRYSSDNASWGNWTLYGTDTSSPWQWSFTSQFGNGYYEFYSTAADMANNTEQAPTTADARCAINNALPGTPAKISPLDEAVVNDNTPTFTWSAVTGSIAEYELWVDDDIDFSPPIKILENTGNTTSYTSTIELSDGNYSWRVRAWNQAGEPSPFEQAWRFTINTNQSIVCRGVNVSIFPSSQSGSPGTPLTFTVTVTNTGNVTEDYNLSATGTTSSWGLTLPSSIADVAPSKAKIVTLTVKIPDGAANNDSLTITVTAASSENTAVENSATCTARYATAGVTSLTIFPSAFALFPSDSSQVQPLTATLRDGNNNPLWKKTITWAATAGSVDPSSGATDSLGQVSVVYTAPAVADNTLPVTITASFAGDAQYQASSGTSLGIPATLVTKVIGSGGGTVVVTIIGTDVDLLMVQEGALSENKTFTVSQAPPESISGYKMASHIFSIGSSGTIFSIQSTLTLPYDGSELPDGVSEGDLAIYRRTSGGGWELVGGTVNTTANTVSVQIDHLSEYAVMASAPVPNGEGGLPLLIIGVVVAVILIVAIIAVFIIRRR